MTFRPIPPLCPFFTQGVAFTDQTSSDGANRLDRLGKNAVFRGNPAQGDPGFDLLDVPGAVLRAPAAGRAPPYIFTFNIRHAEGRLPDDLAHAEDPNPIPRTDHIAQSTLKASLEGVSTARLDDIHDLFIIGYILHGISCSSSSN